MECKTTHKITLDGAEMEKALLHYLKLKGREVNTLEDRVTIQGIQFKNHEGFEATVVVEEGALIREGGSHSRKSSIVR